MRCGTSETVLPPTVLFNEGWMLRLILEWAARHRQSLSALRFDEGSHWYSEALLPSRFKPRRRGDTGGEGFTHADGVIGHFRLQGTRGDIELLADARQLTVIEAKMASGLSPGTKHAPEFNQAARNVACIAHLVERAGIDPTTIRLAFVVLAPSNRIAEGAFAAVTKSLICEAVDKRAQVFDAAAAAWCAECFAPLLERCSIQAVAWEQVLAEIAAADPESGRQLDQFYAQCLRHNPVRPFGKSAERTADVDTNADPI
jgi:hypothetical protein